MKILFISGWGRSGSTLLDRMLGQIEGFHSAGEIRYVWDRGLLEGRPCGCGRGVHDCEVWGAVLAPYVDLGDDELRRLVAARDAFRTRDCWRSRGVPDDSNTALADYVGHLGQVLSGLTEVTGCRILIDSSKFPSHGALLARVPGVELRVVHLIRDPRAVAYSWGRRRVYDRVDEEKHYIKPHGVARSTAYWVIWNLMVERLWGRAAESEIHLRLRYEDLVGEPERHLTRIAGLFGESPDLDFFRSSHRVDLSPAHMVAGNPLRFESGPVELRLDDEWRRSMPFRQRLTATALGWPLMRRYGYPLTASHPIESPSVCVRETQ